MMGFKSGYQCQRFVSIQGQVSDLYHIIRKHLDAAEYRDFSANANKLWREIALAPAA